MQFRDLFPGVSANYLACVVELGRCGTWLEFGTDDSKGNAFTTIMISQRLENVSDMALRLVQTAAEYQGAGNSSLNLICLETMSQLAANGPKMFRPTVEQCEAMEQVEINLPIEDYSQAYPVVLVEFPDAYLKKLGERLGHRVSRYLMLRWYDREKAVFAGSTSLTKEKFRADELAYFFQHRPEFPSVEAAIQTNVNLSKSDSVTAKLLTRVGMNLMLMLSHFGHRSEASNPSHLERTRRRLKRGAKLDANAIEAATHVHWLLPTQEIVVRGPSAPADDAGDGSHASPQPHWRKGHWRNQRVGPGRAGVKRVLIRPVFVRRAAFVGDLADTSVVYKS